VWSHPQEVGTFKMWSNYEQKVGLKNVYRNRWQYTSRDENVVFIQENNPAVVNDFINTKIGKESFHLVSVIPSKKFDELYKADDWKIMFQLVNKSDDEVIKFFEQMKTREININVPEPKNGSSAIEFVLIVGLLSLFLCGKLLLKNILYI
jgi:hypothetical protein